MKRYGRVGGAICRRAGSAGKYVNGGWPRAKTACASERLTTGHLAHHQNEGNVTKNKLRDDPIFEKIKITPGYVYNVW